MEPKSLKERLEAEAWKYEQGGGELWRIAHALQEQADDIHAHGSHWRQPYQAHAYGWSLRLAPRREGTPE